MQSSTCVGAAVQAMVYSGMNGIGLALVVPCVQSLIADYTLAERRGAAFGVLYFTGAMGAQHIFPVSLHPGSLMHRAQSLTLELSKQRSMVLCLWRALLDEPCSSHGPQITASPARGLKSSVACRKAPLGTALGCCLLRAPGFGKCGTASECRGADRRLLRHQSGQEHDCRGRGLEMRLPPGGPRVAHHQRPHPLAGRGPAAEAGGEALAGLPGHPRVHEARPSWTPPRLPGNPECMRSTQKLGARAELRLALGSTHVTGGLALRPAEDPRRKLAGRLLWISQAIPGA